MNLFLKVFRKYLTELINRFRILHISTKISEHWLKFENKLNSYPKINFGYKLVKTFVSRQKIVIAIQVILWTFYWFSLPNPLFDTPLCTVLTDSKNELLGAHIATDGQYRFPETQNVPEKFAQSIVTFEDKRFFSHIGIDLKALARAVKQNVNSDEVKSGGSTLSMQVIRLSRKNKSRTYFEKFIELILATRLEIRYSKTEILKLYASYAPFGGNVVGIDAASWRYFGISADKLTWAQSATLAVLPNSPAMIHPGKNRQNLLKKRDRLLHKLYETGKIDAETLELALEEYLPDNPTPFPNDAVHLLEKLRAESSDAAVHKSTLIADYQRKTNSIVLQHHKRLKENSINNLAAIILDTQTGEVLAYVGNLTDFYDQTDGNFVDVIQAERSTGSILKPFLYASMLSDGELLPKTLVYDIPTRFGSFSPKNYNRGYDGAVTADRALARSLNIPAARMLRDYGIGKFYRKLEQAGLTSLHNHARHYGLSLVLGGCEAKLWELTAMYASMARSLNNYKARGNKYMTSDYRMPTIIADKNKKNDKEEWTNYEDFSDFDASALWFMFKAMLEVERPDAGSNWERFSSSEPIAWKTGTSFGFRDAWAIGVTPRYTVGVWAGNADGEGRPGLVGVFAAAPVLFDIFSFLPDSDSWFPFPAADMRETDICQLSGYIAGANCPDTKRTAIPASGLNTDVCPYHKIIHLDANREFRVHAGCESTDNIRSEAWFVLPPSVENHYKTKHASYRFLPPYRPDCEPEGDRSGTDMELLYPHDNLKLYLPVEIDGTQGKTVFEAAHRRASAHIFWYIDDKLIAETHNIHSIELRPNKGIHTLTLTDELGETLSRTFEVLNETNN